MTEAEGMSLPGLSIGEYAAAIGLRSVPGPGPRHRAGLTEADLERVAAAKVEAAEPGPWNDSRLWQPGEEFMLAAFTFDAVEGYLLGDVDESPWGAATARYIRDYWPSCGDGKRHMFAGLRRQYLKRQKLTWPAGVEWPGRLRARVVEIGGDAGEDAGPGADGDDK